MPGPDTVQLILASQSPRRRELLQQMQLDFHVHVVGIDESLGSNEQPEAYVMRMAVEKAVAAYDSLRNEHKKFGRLIILGADTAVVIGNELLGKPDTEGTAFKHLSLLSGQTHHVLTAVALISGGQDDKKPDIQTVVSRSEVEFMSLTEQQIKSYLKSDEPYDKAGGYAIQGRAAMFIKKITGSYSGIKGLPVFETAELLRAKGFEI